MADRLKTTALIGSSLVGLLGAMALFTRHQSNKAEAQNPPQGRFLNVDGIRLHYLDRGEGDPIVFIHGNGSSVADLELSSITALPRERHRVIAIDRPGFGYSERPEGQAFTAGEQARLIAKALGQLGVRSPLVVAHSWGTLIALEMALQKEFPIRGLVLLSGYYFPTARVDVVVAATPAIPVVGTLLRHTISPLLSRLLWSRIRNRLFYPAVPTPSFLGFPVWMALRAESLRAAGAESGMMVPTASELQDRYGQVSVPTWVVAGEGDRVSEIEQSRQLHQRIPGSELRTFPDVGHMIHHTIPLEVWKIIEEASDRTGGLAIARPEHRSDLPVRVH
jgi:pimeloyl-ACP methyl ester carboxylesterase